MRKKVLIPLPLNDFDPSECAIPWKILKEQGIDVHFATPNGAKATCDLRMLNGSGLGVFAPFLKVNKDALKAHLELEKSIEFQTPISWEQIKSIDYNGIILPGGHAKGMREYLESTILQKIVSEFFIEDKPVGAICHGVVLAARSKINGESVLKKRKTTALLKSQEMLAWLLTCLWLGSYYRTYTQTVEAEVKQCLESSEQFKHGPTPLFRDSPKNLTNGFVVKDRNYLSARWPGDAHCFAFEFVKVLG
jgi:protease I